MHPCCAGTAAAVLATALLLAALAGPCGAVQQAGEASGAAINAAGAQPTDAAAHLAAAAAAASLEAAAQDDSVRCRLSGICEGPPTGCTGSDDAACEHDDEDARLACLTSDAERAAAVQAAARHAWGGYRCASPALSWCLVVGSSAAFMAVPARQAHGGCTAAWRALPPCFIAGCASLPGVCVLCRRDCAWGQDELLPIR